MRVWAADAMFVVGGAVSLFTLLRSARLQVRYFKTLRHGVPTGPPPRARLEATYSLAVDGVLGGLGLTLVLGGLALNGTVSTSYVLIGPAIAVASGMSALTMRYVLTRTKR